ncbi:hypothetical protein HTZ97_12470 [Desulfuromonas acetoxidans]|uniref:Uncharacterized protein n=1 Tax=Desulfuromonas acetoxidans (strain DSM 684 / 11070) TaxID=281689 RepID=Q1JWU9_DESA6|nr:hypothetical protein [Desulfuromonas acetoxidans]EAT14695.1 hypothetical protein Dace_0660 [Desulfuromonas acetoxidans DSM 684]MBF0646307.1 hypothetical protein [Desulfuromonas acetoxidans]NVD25116.1 hypothetical protein [Desulfuromonas acetoxidans]NVE17263.1 hypothetical protein [Desulfuromonas acetoxidans]
MKSELRAYIAYVAAKLAKQENLQMSVLDLDGNVQRDLTEMCQLRPVKSTAQQRECGMVRSADGENFCMVLPQEEQHTCLSVYGQLFDGYDHDSDSHFSGFINDDLVELYDYKCSDHFSYQL